MITPDQALAFGTVAMLFATPVSVIISTVLQRRDASKAAEKVAIVAEVARAQGDKLDQIHGLVNSNMTASMQSELDAYRANLVLLLEVAALRGQVPGPEALLVINKTRDRIAELEQKLADRLKTTLAP